MPSLALEPFWKTCNAAWQEEAGWKIPASFTPGEADRSTTLTDQSHRGKIKVTGTERLSFLNRMLTNDITQLADGQGQRSFLLSAQGKCLADFRVFAAPDFFLLDTEPGLAPEALKLLDRFIITDDVQLEDVTLAWIHLSIDGPEAFQFRPQLQAQLPRAVLFDLAKTASLAGLAALHLFIPEEAAQQAAEALQTLGLPYAGHQAFQQKRRASKTPRFKVDFDETWVLNETGLEETASSETKGCYPGQEVVARMKTYKKDARKLFL